ncbi:hypothetical protein HYC85_030415 [Camellia sinensis]|uniref:Uncharacterized protein n=1 Tax=Camellia sinensis TaxID=4442 RepID=A0A7J7G4J5_CAMSI|nr:hypothetical protein HYC85_030415 [Camellia sinensis]
MSSRGAGSSRRQRNPKVWLLPPFTYDYKSEKYSSSKDYYAVSRIKKENNRMLMRRCRHFMLQLAIEMAKASNRDLTVTERNNVLNNEKYLSDYYILATRFMGGSRNRRGDRNLQRGESSRRGGGRGCGDAEDDSWEGVGIPVLDYACGYRDRFGKRHFFMPKYYPVQGGSCMEPSDNQTEYGLSYATRLKWPAIFIERVQLETLSRENQLKVPKARSVEIQKEDPDNVDRLCERLQRKISQMRRRLARDMHLYIVKKDAQKNKTEPNVVVIKGIMEDSELVSDAELSDYSDSEPPADLSAN